MEQTTRQDAITFLTDQHQQVRELFSAIDRAEPAERTELFQTLVRMLAVHETAEEMVLYPTARTVGDAGADGIVEARLREEDQAKKDLVDLERMDPTTPEFMTAFARFRTAVEQHAEAEEHEVFPIVADAKDSDQLARMTAALQVAEGMAPTHPHKAAPESAVGNLLVGPFVAMVDRVRDALRAST